MWQQLRGCTWLAPLLSIHSTWQLSFLLPRSFWAPSFSRLCSKYCTYSKNSFHTTSASQVPKTFPWNFSKQNWRKSLLFCVSLYSPFFPLMIHCITAPWVHVFTPEGRYHAFLSFLLPTCLQGRSHHTSQMYRIQTYWITIVALINCRITDALCNIAFPF